MRKIILILASMVMLSGCSAIKERAISEDLENFTGAVKSVCTTLEIFQVDAVDPEICNIVIAGIDSQYYSTLYDVAQCIDKHDPKTTQFVQCIDDVDGWKLLSEYISGKM